MSTDIPAVILARGLGTRLRAAAEVGLDAESAAIAATGVKALMPIGGRPFLDHLLHILAGVGVREVVLVIGPEHEALRRYYSTLATSRLRLRFAVQERPRGTADAVAAAGVAVGGRDCLVLNSDNLYPAGALAGLLAQPGAALVGYRRSGLARGNIDPATIARFAIVRERDGWLDEVIEKPSDPQRYGGDPMLSMNCWRFTASIFAACAQVQPSPRGELELPDAVRLDLAGGTRYRVLPCAEPVLDLSSKADIAPLRAALAGTDVSL
jgi:dTDP-glucose pyrophosphorylase